MSLSWCDTVSRSPPTIRRSAARGTASVPSRVPQSSGRFHRMTTAGVPIRETRCSSGRCSCPTTRSAASARAAYSARAADQGRPRRGRARRRLGDREVPRPKAKTTRNPTAAPDSPRGQQISRQATRLFSVSLPGAAAPIVPAPLLPAVFRASRPRVVPSGPRLAAGGRRPDPGDPIVPPAGSGCLQLCDTSVSGSTIDRVSNRRSRARSRRRRRAMAIPTLSGTPNGAERIVGLGVSVEVHCQIERPPTPGEGSPGDRARPADSVGACGLQRSPPSSMPESPCKCLGRARESAVTRTWAQGPSGPKRRHRMDDVADQEDLRDETLLKISGRTPSRASGMRQRRGA